MGAYLPSLSEVSYVFGVLISSGTKSSSSSSFSSVSVSVAFRFWTIFSFPFNISRSISSQRTYLPSRPRRQCLFFRFISPFVLTFFVLRSSFGLKKWAQNKFSVHYFPSVCFYGTFCSAYCGLFFILEFSF